MTPYSQDLRQRFVDTIQRRDRSVRRTARCFPVGVSFDTRLSQLHSGSGSLEPRPHGGGDHDDNPRSRSGPVWVSKRQRRGCYRRRGDPDRADGLEGQRVSAVGGANQGDGVCGIEFVLT